MRNNVCINFLAVLFSCHLMAQEVKQLTPDKYSLWSEMESIKISPNGKWVSYNLQYESGNDTVFLKNVNSLKTLNFPKGNQEKFNDKNHFAVLDRNNKFSLVELSSLHNIVLENVTKFEFVKQGNQIAVIRQNKQNITSQLEIIDLNGNILYAIEGVSAFKTSPNQDQLIYIAKVKNRSTIGNLKLSNKIVETKITESGEGNFINPVWHPNGESVTFVLQNQNALLFQFNCKQNKLYTLNPKNTTNWPSDYVITAFQNHLLSVSEDGEKVFFIISENDENKSDPNAPQIWKADDRYLPPYRAEVRKTLFGIWIPKSNSFTVMGNEYETIISLSGNQNQVITADQKPYSPTIKSESDADIYITNINSGDKKLVIKQHLSDYPQIVCSPSGKFLTYFRNDDWWLYNIALDKHIAVTKDIATSFKSEFHDYGSAIPPYGLAGWSPDEKWILLYDRFDIWAVTPDGKIKKRLTKGKEKNLRFRFHLPSESRFITTAFFNRYATYHDINKYAILYGVSEDFSQSGYYTCKKDKEEQVIIRESKSVNSLVKANDSDKFIFTVQDANQPPALMMKSVNEKYSHKIVQSNEHYSQFGTNKSEHIEYADAKGQKLKGVLVYPFHYRPEIKYPMIVHIYEKQTSLLHKYINPTLYNSDGFNATILASQGYFVLYPSFQYEVNKVPFNATEQIIAAVKKAVSMASIDKENIGLIGHSFGGYQTNFIISQTNLFKAAVSGASISDDVSLYLSLFEKFKSPRFYMSEFFQHRIALNLFDSYETYVRNSPVHHAKKIETPLLLWSGDRDTTVPHNQSMMLYFALRRLNKKNTMILYPNEGHTLFNPKNQMDLTSKILNWFDHYLKGKPLPKEL